ATTSSAIRALASFKFGIDIVPPGSGIMLYLTPTLARAVKIKLLDYSGEPLRISVRSFLT
ncbi:MAG: hypothetical protein Q8Q07_06830, partial [Dehalococcoidales bacterium]|nr:hypothetical protein [Dehalococcoidales bacterium]